MSLLLLLGAGVGARRTPDRHDGVWDADQYRKYQERLKRQREKLEALERGDEKRKLELRKRLTRLYRGLPEETVAAAIEPGTPYVRKQQAKQQDFGVILGALSNIQSALEASQAAMVREYREIERRERLRLEAEDEEEIELILTAIL